MNESGVGARDGHLPRAPHMPKPRLELRHLLFHSSALPLSYFGLTCETAVCAFKRCSQRNIHLDVIQ